MQGNIKKLISNKNNILAKKVLRSNKNATKWTSSKWKIFHTKFTRIIKTSIPRVYPSQNLRLI